MARHLIQTSIIIEEPNYFANHTTTSDNWEDVDSWDTSGLKTKAFGFTATTNNLSVQILGSLDSGASYPYVVVASFTVNTGTPVAQQVTTYYTNLKVQVKTASAGQNGTIATQYAGISN